MKKFFDALKTVYGPQSSETTPLFSADGTSLLTDKETILKRWDEHLDGILNRPLSINDEAINRLPQVECNPLLDELPTVSETVKAIKLLSSGKAPGSDAIPAEIYKAGGPPVAEKLTELFHIIWRKEAIPQEFKDATIIHLFKRKGNPQVCDNHRGISLLSIAGKILARVLLNRMNEHLERSGLLPESQCGFRKNRGTIDMIFTARQLQEKCHEQNVGLYMTFVGLTKAFDTVSREGLWKIMAKFSCPAKFIAMVRLRQHAKRLNHFHTSCLRKLLKIKWQDRIPDTEVLKRAGMQSVYTLLKLAQLRWTGHVTRMPDERLPKKILHGELQVGKRSHAGQKKRYRDTLKASLKNFNIPTESWEQIAQDCTKWRGLKKGSW